SSRRRHTIFSRDWSSDVCSSDLLAFIVALLPAMGAYPIFIMKIMCYALFACAFNLLLAYTGLLSFGHAAFLGGAAYATGHSLAEIGRASCRAALKSGGQTVSKRL